MMIAVMFGRGQFLQILQKCYCLPIFIVAAYFFTNARIQTNLIAYVVFLISRFLWHKI